jgi:hypothetical protein
MPLGPEKSFIIKQFRLIFFDLVDINLGSSLQFQELLDWLQTRISAEEIFFQTLFNTTHLCSHFSNRHQDMRRIMWEKTEHQKEQERSNHSCTHQFDD